MESFSGTKATFLRPSRNRRFRRRNALRIFGLRLDLRAGRASFADVDTALEEGAIFDRNACSHNVSGQGTVAADVNPIAGRQISAYFAENDDFTSANIG